MWVCDIITNRCLSNNLPIPHHIHRQLYILQKKRKTKKNIYRISYPTLTHPSKSDSLQSTNQHDQLRSSCSLGGLTRSYSIPSVIQFKPQKAAITFCIYHCALLLVSSRLCIMAFPLLSLHDQVRKPSTGANSLILIANQGQRNMWL